ncbi:hypothetical protein LB507_010327 [Fusarium sp. FIESC RH6]|nr:hypothetical protein LB507_010327 [Fusarium sp. FIESC RH6]
MSRRENDETALPWDEIMLLPYPKPQDDKKTFPEEHVASERKRGIWPSLRASTTHKYHSFLKSWAIYTSKPWNMCLLVLIGAAFAIGHHLFYDSLDGKEAINQSRMLRYGTALAFFAKASFGTAAAMAFQQRAWLVVRHKMARLETIDSLFTANSNILALLTWSSIKKAKISTLIALYCWITPLVVVLTPVALSVVVEERVENGTCPNVRTLNFSNEKRFFWRDYDEEDPKNLKSLSKIWNTTAEGETINKDDPDEFDYWTYPAWVLDKVIAPRVALENKPLVRNVSGAELCSHGWNCSYILNLTAPGYQCETLTSGVNSEVRNMGNATPPVDMTSLAPKGNWSYFAATKFGEYTYQIASDTRRRPKQRPPYPKNLGAFRTEPIMWIGYCTVEDYSKEQSSMPGKEGWQKAYKPFLLGCEHWEVNYTIQFDWVGETQSHKVLQRRYLRKVVDTTLVSDRDPDTRLKDRTRAVPESNYVLPSDVEEYRLISAYHSLGFVFRNIFQGRASLPNLNSGSRITATPLFDRQRFLPIKDLSHGIREMYENMIISLLSEPSLSVVSWASNGQPTGRYAKSDPSSKGYPCLRKRYAGFFKYNKTQLIIVYAANVALAIAAVSLGLHAYSEEGEMRDMEPSSIIEASRASDLHTMDNKSEVKIGYGLVQNEAGRSVRSFGVEGNLTQPGRQWY